MNNLKNKKKVKAWHVLAGIAVFLAAVIIIGMPPLPAAPSCKT